MTTPAEQAARIRERHAQFQRQYSPGPDWEPFNQTHQDRGWLLAEVERLAQAIEQARREEQERADVIVRDLCDRLRVSEHDRIAYRGALGYPCPGDHNGRLTDGTIPHCGLCPSRAEQARREERDVIARADEALDFAYGALSDAVNNMLDSPAGYAVIRMIQDARRAIRARAQEAQR